jgi:hypothetical protein
MKPSAPVTNIFLNPMGNQMYLKQMDISQNDCRKKTGTTISSRTATNDAC